MPARPNFFFHLNTRSSTDTTLLSSTSRDLLRPGFIDWDLQQYLSSEDFQRFGIQIEKIFSPPSTSTPSLQALWTRLEKLQIPDQINFCLVPKPIEQPTPLMSSVIGEKVPHLNEEAIRQGFQLEAFVKTRHQDAN